MTKKDQYHPMIYSYLKRYQEDPTSRIFAPLAEAYRKAGLLDEALEVVRDGLRIHPTFMSGRVALARVLFDKMLYLDVVNELMPIVQDIPDNLVAQRLLAESCLVLGRLAEALSAYKMLLYFSPQDNETAQIVQELEAQAYEKGALVLRTDAYSSEGQYSPASFSGALPDFTVRSAQAAIESDPSVKRGERIKGIEMLQGLLQKVERYRSLTRL
jgi:tetratricopeptide (TPR) repeat protein